MDSLIGSGQFLDMGAIGKVGNPASYSSMGDATSDQHRYEIKITWKPGTPAQIANTAARISSSTRTTFSSTWNSLLNYYAADKIGKLHNPYIVSIVAYEDGKEYLRAEGFSLAARFKTAAVQTTNISTPESRAADTAAKAAAAAAAAAATAQPAATSDTQPYVPSVSAESQYVSTQNEVLGESPLDNVMVQLGIVGALAAAGVGTVYWLFKGRK